MATLPFIKMHGAGNDFVIFDGRTSPVELNAQQAKHIADRHFGIGCDQVIVMEPSQKADLFMRIYNADGGEVSSCGNASRCVGWLGTRGRKSASVTIETRAGVISSTVDGNNNVTVDMGVPKFHWKEIPLAHEVDTMRLDLELRELKGGVAVSMGNPHAVFFVENVAKVNLAVVGPMMEHHALFPERANISAAQVTSQHAITLRVWERGSGETLACGTAACATLVAAHKKGLVGRKADITLPGGVITVEWLPEEGLQTGHVLMTGPVATAFEGTIIL